MAFKLKRSSILILLSAIILIESPIAVIIACNDYSIKKFKEETNANLKLLSLKYFLENNESEIVLELKGNVVNDDSYVKNEILPYLDFVKKNDNYIHNYSINEYVLIKKDSNVLKLCKNGEASYMSIVFGKFNTYSQSSCYTYSTKFEADDLINAIFIHFGY